MKFTFVLMNSQVEAMAARQLAEAQASQRAQLDRAEAVMQRRLRARHAAHEGVVAGRLASLAADMRARHAIEAEVLEAALARERQPPAHHTRRCLDLLSAEKALSRGQDYKNAFWVKRMADELEIPEKEAAREHFLADQRRRREVLAKKQAFEGRLMDQRALGLTWNDQRRREKQRAVNGLRFAHHRADMAHAHLAERRLRPELNDPPSALLQKRAGHGVTAAALRGQQLAGAARRGGIAAYDPRERCASSTLGYLRPVAPDHEPPPPAKPHGPDLPALTPGHDFVAPLLSTTTSQWTTAAMLRASQKQRQQQQQQQQQAGF